MKALIATACVAVIATTGYFFVQEYRGHQASVAAAKIAHEADTCRLAAAYRTLVPTLYEAKRRDCGF